MPDLSRPADDLTLELLRRFQLEGVTVKLLNIEGLLRSKTDHGEKDLLEKSMLRKLRDQI